MRPQLVETLEQYRFIYEVAMEYADNEAMWKLLIIIIRKKKLQKLLQRSTFIFDWTQEFLPAKKTIILLSSSSLFNETVNFLATAQNTADNVLLPFPKNKTLELPNFVTYRAPYLFL